jgi:hydroxymethylbilane synthase
MQLSLARPDLAIVPLRGNVDTRLRKLEQEELDAVVLARAGLERLGLGARATDTVDPSLVIPAPGQGALAIECRADDTSTRETLAALSDRETEIVVACERGAMRAVGGNCTVPFGAHATRAGDQLELRCILADADGKNPRRVERVVPWPADVEQAAKVGLEVGRSLIRT